MRWNYSQPFAIAQRTDGYCVHHQCDNGHHCGVYERRPLVCRTYSCRDDKRIWLDFDACEINPDILRPDWPKPAPVAQTEETA